MTNTYVVYETNAPHGLRRQTYHTYKQAGNYANYLATCRLCDHVSIDIMLHDGTTSRVLQTIPVLQPA